MSFRYGNQILQLIYIIIGSLDAKTWQSQKRLGTLYKNRSISQLLIAY